MQNRLNPVGNQILGRSRAISTPRQGYSPRHRAISSALQHREPIEAQIVDGAAEIRTPHRWGRDRPFRGKRVGLLPITGSFRAEDTEIQVCMAPAPVIRPGPGGFGPLATPEGSTLRRTCRKLIFDRNPNDRLWRREGYARVGPRHIGCEGRPTAQLALCNSVAFDDTVSERRGGGDLSEEVR